MIEQTKTTITQENGCYFSWCPLSCIGPLSRRIKNSYFINIGMRECAYFIQMGLSRRETDTPFSFAILEDADIGSGNIFEPLKRLVEKAVDNSKPEIIFLMGSCSTEIMKLDIFELSYKLTAEFGVPVIPVQTSGMCNSQSDGEDTVLSGLVDFCYSQSLSDNGLKNEKTGVVLVGSVSDYSASILKNEMENFGIPLTGIFPGNNISEILEISKKLNKNSIIVPLYPYLYNTLRKIKQKYKCKIFNTAFPIGHHGSKIFYSDMCKHFGLSQDLVDETAGRTWKDMGVKANLLKNRKIFIIGDGLFEIPIACFFSNIGADVLEVSTPHINPSMTKELSFLEKSGVSVVEAADIFSQFKRVQKENPGLVIANLSLARAFQAYGFLTFPTVIYLRSEFLGFSNAKHLVEFEPHGTDIGVGLFHPKGVSEDRAFMREVTKKVNEGMVKLSKKEIEKYLEILDEK